MKQLLPDKVLLKINSTKKGNHWIFGRGNILIHFGYLNMILSSYGRLIWSNRKKDVIYDFEVWEESWGEILHKYWEKSENFMRLKRWEYCLKNIDRSSTNIPPHFPFSSHRMFLFFVPSWKQSCCLWSVGWKWCFLIRKQRSWLRTVLKLKGLLSSGFFDGLLWGEISTPDRFNTYVV